MTISYLKESYASLIKLFFNDEQCEITRTNDPNVPSCFNHKSVRTMPIIKEKHKDGLFMFSSPESLEKYKQLNSKYFGELNINGFGIPYLHIIRIVSPIGFPFVDNCSSFKIYKYEVRNASDPLPLEYPHFEIITSSNHLKLYKILICSIDQFNYEMLGSGKFYFQYYMPDFPISNMLMRWKGLMSDYHFQMDEMNFNWRQCFQFNSKGYVHHRLRLTDVTVPQQDNSTVIANSLERKFKKKNLKQNVIVAHLLRIPIKPYDFTRGRGSDFFQWTDLEIGEDSQFHTLGIQDISPLKERIACQGLFFSYREVEKYELYIYDAVDFMYLPELMGWDEFYRWKAMNPKTLVVMLAGNK
ncbi:uncharacterized protein NDAI_0C06330 [Naumovozyma dairenensis CBS 421]|uniref:Uncharacterized protein n=1 Tax=Naumovozyma dairenensis (strain ATCC 10597 / BCRC 20456 / CBS 421 / NBRC 0211 / NRRL Y-12639) TaxID=1071378 RepID=G0W931_NAUDC|nr:hypothetical protein NDAI_0C06330 [Naumovozyma dairenensis CBS 421]CCD24292.1 hypothetical protein NDAI_0C06330 [Naumovozyma dairenensis CBS 421]